MGIAAVQEDWNFEFGWLRSDRSNCVTRPGRVGHGALHPAGATNGSGQLALERPRGLCLSRGTRLGARLQKGLEESSTTVSTSSFPVFSGQSRQRCRSRPRLTLDVGRWTARGRSGRWVEVLALGGVVADEWKIVRSPPVSEYRPCSSPPPTLG